MTPAISLFQKIKPQPPRQPYPFWRHFQYPLHRRGPLVGLFRQQATESMDHAIKLGEKITALGGHPTVNVSQIFEPGQQTLEEMLKENLEAEEEALREYKKHLKEAQDDVALRILLEQIVFEEQSHVDDLRKYLAK